MRGQMAGVGDTVAASWEQRQVKLGSLCTHGPQLECTSKQFVTASGTTA